MEKKHFQTDPNPFPDPKFLVVSRRKKSLKLVIVGEEEVAQNSVRIRKHGCFSFTMAIAYFVHTVKHVYIPNLIQFKYTEYLLYNVCSVKNFHTATKIYKSSAGFKLSRPSSRTLNYDPMSQGITSFIPSNPLHFFRSTILSCNIFQENQSNYSQIC